MAVQQKLINNYILEGQFGLEKESLRVDEHGFLAHTPHPFTESEKIDRDFCENQIEIITGVNGSAEAVYEELKGLHNTAVRRLYHLKSGREYIWNFSNPPFVKSEEDIPIAKFHGEFHGKELYREYLAEKYGKKKMLFSGIHFNFSFSENYLREAFEESRLENYGEFKNRLYLNLAQKVVRYGWLIVYLTAASPLMDGSFENYNDLGKDILSPYASGRCSEIGYWNDFVPIIDYSDLNTYVDSIQEYVDLGQLKNPAELYYPVRLKPLGEHSLKNLKETGVNHIELRNIDLNPLADTGVQREDIEFLHLLLVYLNVQEDRKLEDFEQIMAIRNIKESARFDDESIVIETGWSNKENIRKEALGILTEMEEFFRKPGWEETQKVLDYQKNKVINEKERYAKKIMNAFDGGYVKQGLEAAKTYAKKIQREKI